MFELDSYSLREAGLYTIFAHFFQNIKSKQKLVDKNRVVNQESEVIMISYVIHSVYILLLCIYYRQEKIRGFLSEVLTSVGTFNSYPG